MKSEDEKLNEAYKKACQDWFLKRFREIDEEFWKDPVGNTLKSWRKNKNDKGDVDENK